MYIDVSQSKSQSTQVQSCTELHTIIMLELVSEQNYVIALSTMLFASVGKMLPFLAAKIEY